MKKTGFQILPSDTRYIEGIASPDYKLPSNVNQLRRYLILLLLIFASKINVSFQDCQKNSFQAGHYVALLTNTDYIKAWGRGNLGQLGTGNSLHLGDGLGEMGDYLPFVDLGTHQPITTLAVGFGTTCPLFADFKVKCWGYGNNGQLGSGNTQYLGDDPGEMGDNLTFVDFGVGVEPILIYSSDNHKCVITMDRMVKCWGYGTFGQLGYGSGADRGALPGQMGDYLPYVSLGSNISSVMTVGLSSATTCAIITTSDMKCWGSSFNGQLGYGDTINRGDQANEMGDYLPFVDVGTGVNLERIESGNEINCILTDMGALKCWGYNDNGQLGYGDTVNRGDVGGQMGDYLPFIDIGTGRIVIDFNVGLDHACVILDNSKIVCWGSNGSGQLGVGNMDTIGDEMYEMGDNLTFTDVGSIPPTNIFLGLDFSCVLLNDNTYKCWGENNYGQLGQEDQNNRGSQPLEMGDNLSVIDLGTNVEVEVCQDYSPTLSPTIFTFPTISCKSDFTGDYHVCALTISNGVKCWGRNADGQLGYEDTEDRGDEVGEMGECEVRIE